MASETGSSDRPEKDAAAPRLHVLLADDSSFGQKVGRSFLEELGCSVDVVENGEAAVSRACEQRYDAIFMDCQMPVMDGYEASKRIRLVPGLERLPIIALTAETTDEARRRWLDAGATDFVSKPYRPDVLDTVLRGLSKQTPVAAITGPACSCEAVFQPEEIWERFGGDVELMGEILALIDRDLPQYIVGLREAVAGADWALAARLAHTIKGTVGEVAAVHLPGLAVAIEKAAIGSNSHAAAALVPRLEAAASELLAALHAWKSTVPLAQQGSL